MKQIIQSLVQKDAKYIQMPAWYGGEVEKSWGNLAHPDPYVLSAKAEYPMGTKFVDGTRTWFYSHFRGTTEDVQTEVTDENCAYHMFGKGLIGHAYLKDYTAGYIRALSASKTIVLGTTDTIEYLGSMKVNHAYAGGWLTVSDSAQDNLQFGFYRIVESGYSGSSVVVDGTTMATPTTLTVDHETPAAISTSAICTVMPNQWKHLIFNPEQSKSLMCPILGASCIGDITGAGYLWAQTYGEIGTMHWTDDIPGDINGQVDMVWSSDGSMNPKSAIATAQKAGYIVGNPRSMDGTPTTEGYAVVFLTMIR